MIVSVPGHIAEDQVDAGRTRALPDYRQLDALGGSGRSHGNGGGIRLALHSQRGRARCDGHEPVVATTTNPLTASLRSYRNVRFEIDTSCSPDSSIAVWT